MVKGETCECGRCGACIDAIDLMEKEQRRELTPAEDKHACYLEQHCRIDDGLVNNNIHLSDSHKRLAAIRWEERNAKAWWVTEDANESAYEAGSLSMFMRQCTTPKKMFDPREPGRECAFCKRRGHYTGTCMVTPVAQAMITHVGMTELQRAKQRFVIGLLGRWRPTTDTRGSRMEQAMRVMEQGRVANVGNPWKDR